MRRNGEKDKKQSGNEDGKRTAKAQRTEDGRLRTELTADEHGVKPRGGHAAIRG
jgi:hypothetical protein